MSSCWFFIWNISVWDLISLLKFSLCVAKTCTSRAHKSSSTQFKSLSHCSADSKQNICVCSINITMWGKMTQSLPRHHCNVDLFLSFSENLFPFFPFLPSFKEKEITSGYRKAFSKWPCSELEGGSYFHHDFQSIQCDSSLDFLYIIKKQVHIQ